MGKLPKIFLNTTIALTVLCLIPATTTFHYGALRPLAAVSFILFMTAEFLDREVQEYNQQHSSHCEQTGKPKK